MDDYTKDSVVVHGLAEEQSHRDLLDRTDSFFNDSVNLLLNATGANDSLLGNQTDGYIPYGERWETYIVPTLFAIIFIIGVLGNGVLIITFIKYKTMRNVPNMYICSLAVGDILVIFFCVPFTSTVYTVENWPYGLVICKFSEFSKDVSIGVSVFTLVALSADRYFAIVDPMRKLPGRRATRITCITIAGIWIASIALALPAVLFSYVREFGNDDGSMTFQICYPFPEEYGFEYAKFMVLARFLIYYAIPLILIGTFYIIMARHLVHSTKNMPGEMQGQQRQIQGRKKVAKMVYSFVIIFAICFFPSHLFFLWFYFDPHALENYNLFWNYVRIVGFCLGFMNSCINPITLYCVSGTFRKHFDKHLFCCICKGDARSAVAKGRFPGGSVSNNYSNHHLYGNDRIQRNGCRPNSAAHNHQLLSLTTLNAQPNNHHHYHPHCSCNNCSIFNNHSSHRNALNNKRSAGGGGGGGAPAPPRAGGCRGSTDFGNPTDATELLMSTKFDGTLEGTLPKNGTTTRPLLATEPLVIHVVDEDTEDQTIETQVTLTNFASAK